MSFKLSNMLFSQGNCGFSERMFLNMNVNALKRSVEHKGSHHFITLERSDIFPHTGFRKSDRVNLTSIPRDAVVLMSRPRTRDAVREGGSYQISLHGYTHNTSSLTRHGRIFSFQRRSYSPIVQFYELLGFLCFLFGF